MLAQTCVFALDTPMDPHPHPMYSSCPDVSECSVRWYEYVGPLPSFRSAGGRVLLLPGMTYPGLYAGNRSKYQLPAKAPPTSSSLPVQAAG